MRIQRGPAREVVFLLGQQVNQFGAARLPVFLPLLGFRVRKRIGQSTPADIPGQDALLGAGGAPALGLDRLQGADGRDVVAELLGLTTLAQSKLGRDAEVGCLDVVGGYRLGRLAEKIGPYRFGATFF